MVERKGDISNLTFAQLADELARLRAAVELHRPQMFDKYGHRTDAPAKARNIRCGPCAMNVPAAGCPTWKTAYPPPPPVSSAEAGETHRYVPNPTLGDRTGPCAAPGSGGALSCGRGFGADIHHPSPDGGCVETRFDDRGDCLGDLTAVEFLTNLGAVATQQGRIGFMCASHAEQAGHAGEAQMLD